MKILVVDDVRENVLLLASVLGRLGYAVVTASGGIDAIEKVTAEEPDIVLLDIMMPDMDGIEVTKHLREQLGLDDLPILLVSALDQEENVVRGLEAGAQDYITKPYNPQILAARVRTAARAREHNRAIDEINRKLHAYAQGLQEMTDRARDALGPPLRALESGLEVLQVEGGDLGEELERVRAAASDLREWAEGFVGAGDSVLEDGRGGESRRY